MKKQSGKKKLVINENLFLIKININRAGIFPLIYTELGMKISSTSGTVRPSRM